MGGVDQTNTCLLTMIVVLCIVFCLGSSSLRGSYLNLSKESKTCEKTYTRIQHTPHLNVLHSLLRFHWIWFMKSRNEIPARENGLTRTTILLSLVTCAPFLMVAGLVPCAPFVTTRGLVACAPFLTTAGLVACASFLTTAGLVAFAPFLTTAGLVACAPFLTTAGLADCTPFLTVAGLAAYHLL